MISAQDEQYGVSIMMACYNAKPAHLFEAINSITAQGLPEDQYEILLVDDGSTDVETRVAIRNIEAQPDLYPNVRIFRTPNQGQSAARNLAIEHAKYKYISGLDSDDRLNVTGDFINKHGSYYMRAIQQLKNDDALAFIHCCYTPFYDDGRRVDHLMPPPSLRHNLTKGVGVYAVTRRQDVLAVGGFPGNLDCAEDWAMIISVINMRLEAGKGIGVLRYPEKYYDYRQHDHDENVNARERDYPRFFRDLVVQNRSVYKHLFGEGSARELTEKLYRAHFDLDIDKTHYRLKMIWDSPMQAVSIAPTFFMNRVNHMRFKLGLRDESPFKSHAEAQKEFDFQMARLFDHTGEPIPEIGDWSNYLSGFMVCGDEPPTVAAE